MNEHVILLSIPGLREKDVAGMTHLRELTAGGEIVNLSPNFPCVTCPVQAAMTTGKRPRSHGVVANGFYWREKRRVEMWTSPNDCVDRPQIWDLLYQGNGELTSAVWFPLHAKGCGADYVCTPSPIHNPDGSETLWCYTRPENLYGTLRQELGDFPLQHFWGPMANVKGTAWIVDSAVCAAREHKPNFFYIYLPHLDYAAQRTGPDSEPALAAVQELDEQLGRLAAGLAEAYGTEKLLWLVAGEYAITPVNHVTYPNRILREAGLLQVRQTDEGEQLDFQASRAWAMVDHQFSHVFVPGADRAVIEQVAKLFTRREGFSEALTAEQLTKYKLNHPRSGDLVLISSPNSWQAYYWWLDDSQAPKYARTVDIHRKPGYDPVELHFDPATKSIPLDATLVKGSHGAPVRDSSQKTVLISNEPGLFPHRVVADIDVFEVVMRRFGIELDSAAM